MTIYKKDYEELKKYQEGEYRAHNNEVKQCVRVVENGLPTIESKNKILKKLDTHLCKRNRAFEEIKKYNKKIKEN